MKRLINIMLLFSFFSCGFGTVIPEQKYDLFLNELKFYNAFLDKEFDSKTYVYTLFADEGASFRVEAKSSLIITKILINELKMSDTNTYSAVLTASEIKNDVFTIKVLTAPGKNENKYTFNIVRKKFVFLEKIEIYLPNEPVKEMSNITINGTSVYSDLIPYNTIEILPIVPEEKIGLVDIYLDDVLIETKTLINISSEVNEFRIDIKSKEGQSVEEVYYIIKFEKSTDLNYASASINYSGFDILEPLTNINTEYQFQQDADCDLGPFLIHDYAVISANLLLGFSLDKVKLRYDGSIYNQGQGIPLDVSELSGLNDSKDFMIEAFIEGSSNIKKFYKIRVLKYTSMFLDQFYLKDVESHKFFIVGDGQLPIKVLNHTSDLFSCKFANLYFSPSFEGDPIPQNFKFYKNDNEVSIVGAPSTECDGNKCYKVELETVCGTETFKIKIKYKENPYKELMYTFSFNR